MKALLLLATLALVAAQAPSRQPSSPEPKEKTKWTTATVKPGEEVTNKDGVKVTTDPKSKADIMVTPAVGTSKSMTEVEFATRATGSVEGLDSNDTVNVSASAKPTVSGTGGTVNLNGTGISGTVSNTGGPGSNPISVNFHGGGTIVVDPGVKLVVGT